jgi:hypothetical protein
MSTAPVPSSPAGSKPPAPVPAAKREITLISHSMLFYWWPIWLIGFTMAAITYFEDHRLAVLPSGSTVVKLPPKEKEDEKSTYFALGIVKGTETPSLNHAVKETLEAGETRAPFPTRVSQKAWMGPIFCVVLLLTVVITNVPLRGLWSFLVLLMVLVLVLLISLVEGWNRLLVALGNLHIYINMAGYLFIATIVFILWAVSVFIFDQRTYIVITPGSIKVCEHVGASIRNFDTQGLAFEKQRDDLFRHWLLGFFSGDLIVKTSGAERETIRLPNVLWIGWRLEEVQHLLREKSTVIAG